MGCTPGAGDVVYGQVDRAQLRHPNTKHIVLILSILTGLWRRLITRRTDCYLQIDWDEVWPMKIHHEPLIMLIAFPHNIHRSTEVGYCSLLD